MYVSQTKSGCEKYNLKSDKLLRTYVYFLLNVRGGRAFVLSCSNKYVFYLDNILGKNPVINLNNKLFNFTCSPCITTGYECVFSCCAPSLSLN